LQNVFVENELRLLTFIVTQYKCKKNAAKKNETQLFPLISFKGFIILIKLNILLIKRKNFWYWM